MELEIEHQIKSLKLDNDQDCTNVKQCIKNVIKNECFVKYSIDKRVYTPDGGSFLGVFCEIDIKGETEVNEKKHTNLFVKIITPGEQMSLMSLTDAYKKELFIYCELSQIFEELQAEASIPNDERFKIVKGYKESTPSIIILENMMKKGYKTLYRMDTITIEYAEVAIIELAKFHALSFVLEAKKPKYYERKIKTINQPFVFDEDYKGLAQNMCKATLSCLCSDSRKRFEDFMVTLFDKYTNHLTTKCGKDVLCHGDYRPSNILMKKTLLDMELEIEHQIKSLKLDNDQDCTNVKQCIKNVIKNECFVKYSIDKRVYTPDGGSFLGVFCEIDIKGETEENEKKHTNLFVKIITPGEQMSLMSLTDAYKKELFIYCELSQIFEELQAEASIPNDERFKIVKGYKESTPSIIILENMMKKGYKTLYRMDTITIEYAEVAIIELAKFHALSFVLEAKKPKYYERKIKTINQPFVFDEDYKGLAQNMCKATLSCLCSDSRKRFEDFMVTLFDKYTNHLTTKCGKDVLCHGDYRPSNILMKKTNGAITELIPIDFQLIYHGCPVMDFAYFIFPSTDQEFRKKHLQDLKELYYISLGTFLSYFDLDVEKFYSKKHFEDHFMERLDYGLIISVLLVPFLLANGTERPDITKGTLSGLNFGVDDRFQKRMAGLVEDFIEWGYL